MRNLRDSTIRSLNYGDGPRKVYDGEGMFILLSETKRGTSKHFKYDYVVGGKRKQISYGKFPDISLKQARALHLETRSLVARGIDPVALRKEKRRERTADQRTVDDLAAEYFDSRNDWKPSHRKKQLCRWDKHVAPFIGAEPIKAITRKQVKARLREIQADSIDTARRVQSLIDQVFVYAEVSDCLLYTSPSPRDRTRSRMPSSA